MKVQYAFKNSAQWVRESVLREAEDFGINAEIKQDESSTRTNDGVLVLESEYQRRLDDFLKYIENDSVFKNHFQRENMIEV